jgi:3-methyladenine DNA glycosylase/8-oxoguanine DNA glycosylase
VIRGSVEIRPFDLARTFAMGRFGLYDPTASVSPRRLRKAFATASGPCVVELEARDGGVGYAVDGGDEREVAADLEEALATDDGLDAFAPDHPVLAKLHRSLPGLRLVRVPWRFDVALSTVLQQRVTVREAWQQWSRIAARYGEKCGDLRVAPSAERVAQLETWRLEELGVDPKRARAAVAIARDFHRRGSLAWTDRARIRKHLHAIRGIGPWTTEMTLGFGWGDPDALPLADVHLPHLVAWALAHESRGTDERMIELLEPMRGHRFRAVRLLLAGVRR